MKKLLLLLLILSQSVLFAQEQDTSFCDAGGKKFRFAVLPNAHVQQGVLLDSFVIVIAASEPVAGTIHYVERNNQTRRHQFAITDSSGGTFRFSTWWGNAELIGVNNGIDAFPEPRSEGERISRRSFYIEADANITVYGLNHGIFTADAVAYFPIEGCGTEYIVSTLPEQFDAPNNPERLFPSQFVITATEDGTTVSIEPSAPTRRNGTRTQNITLQAGETYLVQSAGNSALSPADLTGTAIRSNKPIAVIAGHQRAKVPGDAVELRSRDCLNTMLVPVEKWGREYTVFPFPKSADHVGEQTDLVMITAAFADTRIVLPDTAFTLQRGERAMLPLANAMLITGDKNFSVFPLRRTSVLESDPILLFRRGDPMYFQLLPSDFMAKDYHLPLLQVRQSGEFAYPERYVMLDIERAALSGLLVNNNPVPSSATEMAVEGAANRVIITIPIGPNEQDMRLSADAPFAAYVVGYGAASAYGYTAQRACSRRDTVAFDPVDASAPTVRVDSECYGVRIQVIESRPFDSGVDTIFVVSSNNVELDITPFEKGAELAFARATLVNNTRDGQIIIEVRDRAGNSSTIELEIPGFTVFPKESPDSTTPVTFEIITEQERDTCFTVTIHNYGNSPKILTGIAGGGRAIVVTAPGGFPLRLNSGEETVLTICINADSAITFSDTLALVENCGARNAIIINGVIQPPPPVQTGREFYLAFMPNFHNVWTPVQDTIYIYVAANEPTQGRVEYVDFNGNSRFIPFNIPQPSVLTLRIPYIDMELAGVNFNVQLPFLNNENEIISKRSVYIETDKDVTVYALNQAVYTSEAFSVLPVGALGQNYVIASYLSDAFVTGNNNATPSSTPSQFVIIATEDDTEVSIIPKVPTFRFGLREQNITLAKGEVYLVQAAMQRGDTTLDFTGSIVRASKPVAVISGHQRALVPWNRGLLNSRDCLIEQMPPVESWGSRTVLVPLVEPNLNPGVIKDLFRVVAGFDGTEVFLGSTSLGTINQGEFIEAQVPDEAVEVRSTRPALFVYYKHTSGLQSEAFQAPFRPGDPLMMILPPADKYFDEYRFVNGQSFEAGNNAPVFTEQYVTVIIPQQRAGTVELDGTPIPESAFTTIPGTGFAYGHFEVEDGAHVIKADTTFGLYVYGYGIANSYGYVGGGLFTSPTTSVEEVAKNAEGAPKVFPNPVPVGSTVRIQMPPSAALPTDVAIRSSIGRFVDSSVRTTISGDAIAIETGSLAPGVYFAEVQVGSQKVIVPFVVAGGR